MARSARIPAPPLPSVAPLPEREPVLPLPQSVLQLEEALGPPPGLAHQQLEGGVSRLEVVAEVHAERETGALQAVGEDALLDARGGGENGIIIGDRVILNRGAAIQAKVGEIRIGNEGLASTTNPNRPMLGQAHHFRNYAREELPYAITRYTREVTRCYRVMDRRLAKSEFLAGAYSIADMACYGWIVPHKRQGQTLDDFPHLQRWFETIGARPAVKRAMAVGEEKRRKTPDLKADDKAYELLFGDGQLR